MADEKHWWNHWITVGGGIILLTGFIAGGINYLYYNFVTKDVHKTFTEQTVSQFQTLEKETVKQFDVLNKQARRRDLKDSYEKLLDQKYKLKKRLDCGTLDPATKLSLEKDLELN